MRLQMVMGRDEIVPAVRSLRHALQERLFRGVHGVWMHVGTPDAVHAAEEAFLESVA